MNRLALVLSLTFGLSIGSTTPSAESAGLLCSISGSRATCSDNVIRWIGSTLTGATPTQSQAQSAYSYYRLNERAPSGWRTVSSTRLNPR